MPRAKPAQESDAEASVWLFTYSVPLTYPEAKDACGRPVGTVKPGDARILTAAPDEKWRLATKEELGEFIEASDDTDGLRQLGIDPEPEGDARGAGKQAGDSGSKPDGQDSEPPAS